MKLGVLGVVAVVAALLGSVALSPVPAQAAQPPAGGGLSDTTTCTLPVVGDFTCTLTVTRFFAQSGQLFAAGTIANAAGMTIANFTAPVENLQSGATCEILDLTLGPLNLDLLGLVVDLSQVDLTITAVPGSGNLLGNLLCAVARLLDGNSPATGLAALLNRILSILG